MKIKTGFTIKQQQGRTLVEPNEEQSLTFNKVIQLDNSGKLLFEALIEGSDEKSLIALLMEKYNISHDEARKDVNIFIQILKLNQLLED